MPTTGTVDERVVEMRIDHEKFESGAKKTISILESLDKGLKSLGDQHTDGFDNIGGALDKVTHKISFFGTVGDQVIRNLTNKAMALGGQLANAVESLTTAQIAAGWSKYADKTQGVQTIMAATAKDWEDQGAQMEWVNEQLEKLNWFTDETSYNFLEMVNNIGKFTSNGVKLETAVTAMEGISTWAALSGANANEASRAMYNLSQALATGSVKLIDWKSIENANMATREFKETALEMAVALGTLKKNADGTFTTLEGHMFTTEQFNTQLSDGWFSSDVLLQTLQLYGEFTDALNEVCNATDLTASEVLQAVDAYKEGGAASKEYEDTCRRLGFTVSELNPYMKTLADEGYELGYRAFKAAQEAKTFKEAVDATKDAVSTGWMNIFETMFGNYLQAKELWTDIAESFYNIFAEPVNQLQELVNVAFGGLFQKDLSPHLTARDNFIELNEQLEKAGFTWENFVDSFGDYDSTKLESLVNEYGSLNAALQKGAVDAETFEKVLKRMAGIHEGDKPESTSRRIEKVGKDGKKIIELYEGTVVEQEQISEESKNVIDSLIDDAKKYTNTIEEAKTGSEYFTEGLKNLIGVVEDFVNAVDGALQLLFGDNSDPDNIVPWTAVLGERLYFALKAWNDFTDGLRLKQDEETGVDEIADHSERIANVASVFLMVGNAIHTVWSVVTTVVSGIVQAVRESGILSSIGNAILIIFSGLAAVIRPVIDYISDLIAKARELGGMTWVEWLTDKLALLGIYIEFAATKFKEFMETKVAAKVLDVVTRLVGLFTRMKEAFSERGFVGAFEVLQTSFNNFLQRHPRLMKAFNVIKTVFMVIGGAIMLVGSAIAFIVGQIGRFISFISSAFSEGGISAVFDSIIVKLQEVFKDHPRIVNALTTVKQILSELITSIADYFNRLVNFGKRLREAFQENGFAGVIAVISQEINEFLEKHPKLAAFITWVQNAFTKVSEAISKAWTAISSFISGINFQDIFSKLPTLSDIGAFFSGIYTSIVAWFNEIKEKIKAKDFAGVVQTIIDGIKNAFTNAGNKFGEIKTAISGFFEKIGLNKEFFKNLLPNLLEFITTWSEALKGVAIVGILWQVRKLIRNIGWVFDEFSELIGVPKMKALKGIILSIGASILMLAVSLKILSTIPVNDLSDISLIFISLLLALGAFVYGIKLIGAQKSLMSLAALAAAIAVLVFSLISLSKLNSTQYTDGFWYLVFVVGLLLGAMFVIKKIGKMQKSLVSLLSVIALLAAFIIALKVLGKMDVDTFGAGFARLFAVLVILGLFMLAASKMRVKSMKGLLQIVIVLAGFIAALKYLSTMTKDDYESGLYRLFGVLVVLAAFLAVMTALSGGDTFLKFGVGAILLAGSLLVLGLAMDKIGASLPNFVKGLSDAGSVIASNWKTFIIGSVVFGLLAVALGYLVGQIVKLFSGDFGSKFGEFVKKIGEGTTKLLSQIGTGIANAVPHLKPVMLLILLSLASYFFASIPDIVPIMVDGLVSLCTKTAAAFEERKTEITDSISSLISSIFGIASGVLANLLSGFVTDAQTAFTTAFSDGFDLSFLAVAILKYIFLPLLLIFGFMKKLGVGALLVSKTGQTAAAGMIIPLLKVVAIVGALIGLIALVKSGIDEMNKQIDESKKDRNEELFGDRDASIDTRVQQFAELREQLNGMNQEIEDMTKNATIDEILSDEYQTKEAGLLRQREQFELQLINAQAELAQELADITGESYHDVLEELKNADDLTQTAIYQKYLEMLPQHEEAAAEAIKAVEDFEGVGSAPIEVTQPVTIEAVPETAGENGIDISTLFNWSDLSSDAATELETYFGDTGISGQILSSLTGGIESGETNLTDSLTGLLNGSLFDTASDSTMLGSASDVGYNIDSGIAQGINAGTPVISAAISNAVSSVLGGFSNLLGINSPSRVMASLAAFIPAGVAKGIEDNMGTAEGSMTILASGVIAAMEMAMAKVATVADEGFEFNPTITPVVDLSNVSSAAGSVAGMFGGISPMMRGSVAVNADRAQNTAATVMSSKGPSAVDEIQNLSDRLDSMVETMANLQIVLDSGELVGATSRKMDNAFGVMQMRRERGN